MKTYAEKFSWRRGETRWLNILPEDASGVSTAASYSRAQMRISMSGSCVVIEGTPADLDDGTVQGAGFQFELNNTGPEAVRRGTYDFAIWLQSSVGWECVSDDFKIMVLGAC